MRALYLLAAAAAWIVTWIVSLSHPVAWAAVDFAKEVRPVLSDACFHCHGPDASTRMAGLRLDLKAAAFEARKNGAAIVPGKPEDSAILKRIEHAKPALRMPPPQAHKTLSPKQIATLKQWIAEGAPWKEHWAFLAPERHAPPVVKNEAWVRNPIDRFILARLEKEGLTPAAEADRRTLARRVSLDLTGLPPEPRDVEAFLADTRPDAYEHYVAKMMASPHYGEHRARYWLDAARYADTHGLHIDNYREMWQYRDYVIRAFNQNTRFDRFTRDQIAGDLLPNRTVEQWIASGFHRNNVTTNEGGVIEDEVAAMYAKDRVDTTGTVFLGLTVGCATCHDHKFDPILQKDFYSMAAFFRNTTQKPLDGNISDTPPVIFLPAKQDEARWPRVEPELIAARGRMGGLIDARKPGAFREGKRLKAAWRIDSIEAPVDQKPGQALREEANFDWIDADKPFSLAARIYYPKPDDNWTLLSKINGAEELSAKKRGWSFDIQGRQAQFRFFGNENESITARSGANAKMQPGNWYHVVVTYDGSRRKKDSFEVYFNAIRVPVEGRTDNSRPGLLGSVATSEPMRIGTDGGKRKFAGGKLEDLRIYQRVLSSEEVTLLSLLPEARKGNAFAVARWDAFEKDKKVREEMERIAALEREHKEILKRGSVTHVMVERQDQMPSANILFRGMYDQPRDKVMADVPEVLGGLGNKFPKNRLGLAEWLLQKENPLFARVAVNRYWQEVFGTGLVKTADDFGSQGEPPSHPELLDWLAVEFRESGWDVGHMMRLMVTSATYRQQAVASEEKMRVDPDNRLLARGPRFRMDGEMVRDYALAASGLLVRKIGGPSVRPYQPEKIWETVAMEQSDTRFYQQDHGEGLYRRSMYTFWKRSAPPPAMDIFNAPSRENCTVKRERTNTPLQALLTMNDVQFVEAARVLAGQAIKAHKNDFDRQLDFLTERLVTRRFSDKEREISKAAYREFLRHYDSQLADAKKLVATGEWPVDTKVPATEHAALTMLTSQLLNLDEVLNK
jgi:mono/diheme cytochrome c family protein